MSDKARRIAERYLIPGILAVALIITALWASEQKALAKRYENAARAMYTRAYAELTDDLYQLETTLGKLMAVNSPAQYVLLLDEVWRLSGSAVSNMSMLPVSHVETTKLNQFVVRLGDYAHALTKKAVKGGMITPEDGENIAALRDSCGALAAEYEQKYAAGEAPVEAMSYEGFFTESQEYKDSDGVMEFPTLIYDGPFSESSEKAEPKGLSGGEASEAEAEKLAEAVSKVDMAPNGKSNGQIPCYEFSYSEESGGWAEAAVTVQGGRLLWYMASVSGSAEGKPGEEQGRQYAGSALARLKELGYEDMTATYAQYYGGAAVINCAATQGGAILYSDLVKVWVDRDTMEVRGIDARNYLYSHVRRELPEAGITEAEAEAMLSPNLTVEGRAMALIPLSPETEALCYEFKCSLGQEAYIVYINAVNGDEEQIFKIIDSDQGQMVL